MMLLAKTLPALAIISISFISFSTILVEGKGGGDNDCPDPDKPPPLCMGQNSTRDWCVDNGGCDADDDECCCVNFHVNYCGRPGGCNEYLRCAVPPATDASFAAASSAAVSSGQAKEAFEFLNQAAEDAAFADECPEPEEGSVSSAGKGGGGESGCPKDGAITCHETETRGECVRKGGCDANDQDCCCVFYTVPYCGTPSDCNQYLTCKAEGSGFSTASDISDAPADVPDPPSGETMTNAIMFLEEAEKNAKIAADGCPEPASAPSSGNSIGSSTFAAFAGAAIMASVGSALFVV